LALSLYSCFSILEALAHMIASLESSIVSEAAGLRLARSRFAVAKISKAVRGLGFLGAVAGPETRG
jgi:hypothetical protein